METSKQAINNVALRTGFSLTGICVIGGIVFGMVFFLVLGINKESATASVLALAINLALNFLLAKYLLRKFMVLPGKKYQLRFPEAMTEQRFAPYMWKWFFVTLGLALVVGLLMALLPFDSSGLNILGTAAAYMGATWFIVDKMTKSGDAVIDSLPAKTDN